MSGDMAGQMLASRNRNRGLFAGESEPNVGGRIDDVGRWKQMEMGKLEPETSWPCPTC